MLVVHLMASVVTRSMQDVRRPSVLPTVVACSLVAFLGGAVTIIVLDASVPAGVLAGMVLLIWLSGPLVLYLDLARTRRAGDWEPNAPFWLGAWAMPPVNVLAAVGYLYRRHRALVGGATEIGAAAAGKTVGNEGLVSWHRYAVSVFAVYPLVVLFTAVVGQVDWPTLGIIVSLAWVPFGLAFAPLAYLDLRTIPERGVNWGRTRYLYLSSVVSPSAAFWYILRRAWKVQRSSRRRYADNERHDEG